MGTSTLALSLAYDGTLFAGFARQLHQVTVQGELESALALLFRREVETVCAGRTDAGVHALGQVVSFDVASHELEARSLQSLRRSLNALTPEAMSIKAVEEKSVGFSARFDAWAREYRYFIARDPTPPVFMKRFSWHVPYELDKEAMLESVRCLIGEHDFKSFCLTSSSVGKPTCRNLMSVDFREEEIFGESLLVVRVVGSSFLHSMVRTLVGTLLAIGKGKRPASWMEEVLQARDRRVAGETAPASGLVLWHVLY